MPSHDEHQFTTKGHGRLCLRVDDVVCALAELKAKGVRVHPAEDKGQGLLGRFQDPDGNEICLWQYRKE